MATRRPLGPAVSRGVGAFVAIGLLVLLVLGDVGRSEPRTRSPKGPSPFVPVVDSIGQRRLLGDA
jgi:hypothetical protein